MLSPLPLLRPSLRLMPITATVDTALAMVVTATARGLLRLTTAMAAMAHTVMARGPLMLTTDSATAMAAMAHTTDKLQTVSKRKDTSEIKPKFVCCFQKCQELI